MKNKRRKYIILLFIIFSVSLLYQCEDGNINNTAFKFPEISFLDPPVYDEIKLTCEEYWDLSQMNDNSFEVKADGDEYSVNCEGNINGELYQFVIRVDSMGKWINSGYSLIE